MSVGPLDVTPSHVEARTASDLWVPALALGGVHPKGRCDPCTPYDNGDVARHSFEVQWVKIAGAGPIPWPAKDIRSGAARVQEGGPFDSTLGDDWCGQ